jgi:hypothetical protein
MPKGKLRGKGDNMITVERLVEIESAPREAAIFKAEATLLEWIDAL